MTAGIQILWIAIPAGPFNLDEQTQILSKRHLLGIFSQSPLLSGVHCHVCSFLATGSFIDRSGQSFGFSFATDGQSESQLQFQVNVHFQFQAHSTFLLLRHAILWWGRARAGYRRAIQNITGFGTKSFS
jgi:hypothetical protein